MKKIPKSKMDAVDNQQQDEIDWLRRLVWGIVWVVFVTSVVHVGTFIMAMSQFSTILNKIEIESVVEK